MRNKENCFLLENNEIIIDNKELGFNKKQVNIVSVDCKCKTMADRATMDFKDGKNTYQLDFSCQYVYLCEE